MAQQTTLGPFQTFDAQPDVVQAGKSSQRLAASDIASASVQVVASGGENNLHAHAGADEIWFVLDGEVTFYTEGDQVVAKLGRHGGILVPRGAPYWFESSGNEPLVILRFGSKAQNVEDRRIDYTPPSELIQKLLEERGLQAR